MKRDAKILVENDNRELTPVDRTMCLASSHIILLDCSRNMHTLHDQYTFCWGGRGAGN